MNGENKNTSVNHRMIVRRRTQSSTTSSAAYVVNWETFPIDLIVEIFGRFPAETIAICRCVSKQWSSLLRSPSFTRPFLTTWSSTRPLLLFTLAYGGKWHFFSSDHPDDDRVSSVVEADYLMGFSGDWYTDFFLSVNGFIFLYEKQMFKGRMERVPVICNPSTGQVVRLPRVRARNNDLRTFIGYDPVENQFKMLCMTVTYYRQKTNSREHQVMTVGRSGEASWRKIKCWFPHYPEKDRDGICINGVLYYLARIDFTLVVACFDVKSEKFRFIQLEDENVVLLTCVLTLIDFMGKLGVLVYDHGHLERLWVLDDPEKENWSKEIFGLPVRAFGVKRSIWATDRFVKGEIVWAPNRWTYPFYVFYYEVERQLAKRVKIKGIEDMFTGRVRPEGLFTVTNHVENVMFL